MGFSAFLIFLIPKTRKNFVTLNIGAVLIYFSVYLVFLLVSICFIGTWETEKTHQFLNSFHSYLGDLTFPLITHIGDGPLCHLQL